MASKQSLGWCFLIIILSACSTGERRELTSRKSPDWAFAQDHARYVNKATRRLSSPATGKYTITGRCGGFPRVDVKTAPGFCLGLIYDGGGKYRKLRWPAALDKDKILLTEMGGWAPFAGKILMLDLAGGQVALRELISAKSFAANDPRREIIDEPNQISRGPDGSYWVGSVNGIYRFDPLAANPAATVKLVIGDIPGFGLHPLKTFTFDNQDHLYVNVGAASNVCQNYTKFADRDPHKNPANFRAEQFSKCPEVEDPERGQGLIRQYQILPDHSVSPQFTVFAKGLRNSIALTFDPGHGQVLEGENGRDAINKNDPSLSNAELPHERINVLSAGQNFGWPYCYDDTKNNPEWRNVDCAHFSPSTLLIPAHAAPLGMIVYGGNLFPDYYRGRILLSLHGYEPHGHRLVTFDEDSAGRPYGLPKSLIFGWEKRGAQEMGKPVGLAEMADGSVILVEDEPQNKVLRLFYDRAQGDGAPVTEIADAQPAPDEPTPAELAAMKKALDTKLASRSPGPFPQFEHKVIDPICAECHQAAGAPGARLIPFDFEGNAKRILQSGLAHELANMLKGQGNLPSMPPQGWTSPEEQAEAVRLYEQWLSSQP